MLSTVKDELGDEANDYIFSAGSNIESLFNYEMHTLPNEISSSIGTSTLLAAWNAATYVAQVEDDRLQYNLGAGISPLQLFQQHIN